MARFWSDACWMSYIHLRSTCVFKQNDAPLPRSSETKQWLESNLRAILRKERRCDPATICGLKPGIETLGYHSVEPAQTQASGACRLQVRVCYSWKRHGKSQAVFGHNQVVSMCNHIRIRKVTLLAAKLLDTKDNRILSNDVEIAILERTKILLNPVQK